MKLKDHPTVIWFNNYGESQKVTSSHLDAQWLRELCLEAGADDVGFVHINNPAIDDQRSKILDVYPKTKTVISLVARMSREPIKSPARSIANREFHTVGHDVDDIAHHIVRQLEKLNIGALNPSMAFPMEMDRFPGEPTFVVSHKPIAEAAGMGVMGIHRNVIHPKFGNFILLGTILLSQELSVYGTELDFTPCLECKLCVAACPVGAISSEGHFNATACLNHNYREFFGGFVEWAETLAESKNSASYREKVTVSEDASRWQSLSGGANYKTAYCMAVCPAGEDVIGPYLADKKGFLQEIVKPLQQKEEIIYATPTSDAVAFVEKRYPHKKVKLVKGGLQPQSITGFIWGSQISFQREQSKGLNAIFHFEFTGEEIGQYTFSIADKKLTVEEGLHHTPNILIQVDSEAWINLLNNRLNPIWAVLSRKLKIKGERRLLFQFQRCFG